MFAEKSSQIEQDWQKLASYLESKGHTLDLETEIKQFSTGAANMNYLVKLDGLKAVLRCPPQGSAPGANDVEREFKVLSALNTCYPYAPKALHLCKDESVIGVPFCISEFRQGVAIKQQLPAELDGIPNIGDTLGIKAVGILAELHNIDYSSLGLEELGKGEGYLERQVQGWGKRASRVVQGRQLEQAQKIVAWLMDNLPAQRPLSLVHNDFKLDNVLIDLETFEVNAVLDWDMCTIGDPIYDLVLTLLYWGQPDDNEVYRYMAMMPYEAPSWPSRDDALQRYQQIAAHQLEKDDLTFYWVLAVFRYAIVVAQLVALYQKGYLTSGHITAQNEASSLQMIDSLLEEALSTRKGVDKLIQG